MNALAGGPHYPLFQVISLGDNDIHTRYKHKAKRQHPDSPFGFETATTIFTRVTIGDSDPHGRPGIQTPATTFTSDPAPPTTMTTTQSATNTPPIQTQTSISTNAPVNATTSTTSTWSSTNSSMTGLTTRNASKDTSKTVGTPTEVAQIFITSLNVPPNTPFGVGTTAVVPTTLTESSISMTTRVITETSTITTRDSKKNIPGLVIVGSVLGAVLFLLMMIEESGG
ncbi:hypothetical protein L218DRAFT_968094 [Marasmius fiardii PR-910]|nr:hypothetical protein L218DRAFT_968094 [Marasmius fiardii PR-910]